MIDPNYQRKISRSGIAKIRRMQRQWDWARCGALIVTQRQDGYAIIDGQHRAAAARSIDLSELPCVVVAAADPAAEAATFIGVNSARTSLASIDKFRARVASGDVAAVTAAELMGQLEINFDVAAGESIGIRQTRAVTTIEKMITLHGQGPTFTAIEAILDAQPETPGNLTRANITAITRVTAAIIDQDGDLDRFVRVLAELDLETIQDNARTIMQIQRGQQAHHAANIFAREYNKGRQRRIELA